MPVSLSLNSVVRWSDDQLAAAVDDEVVILSVERGSYYGLDDIGSDIWERLAQPIRVDDLCQALTNKYDADSAVIRSDVLQLLERLVSEGLVLVAG